MAKNSIRDYSATNSSNTDIQSIDISEGCSPAGINNAIREVMADLKDVSTGAVALESPAFDSASLTGDLTFGDNDKAIFGNASDLQIYHDGSDSYIRDNGTGDLYIEGSDDIRFRTTSGQTYAVFNENSSVNLYHNNSLKFETTATGVSVTGTVAATSFTGDGSALTGVQAGAGYFDGNNGAAGDTTNGKGDIFRVHSQTLTSNVTIGTTDNALAVGPLTVDSSVTLTVNGNLTVV